ncbi:MAG: hypothetical protein CSA55_00940 [Ilumatobacter coccineus]|uniref:VTT domain-containing protein n=1 Tax=Ilumatobacter coccineus TaxID=467094 RepID=A0A2G6KFL3_9ACTN|nr:MAG: hypothetical protein CSA55_00940 [Ilumatobacter coccineus]
MSFMCASVITDATDWLNSFSSQWWFLLIVFVIALLDSVFPVVPGETMVIIGGVAAGQGHYPLLVVIAAGASGAFVGDNMAYTIGYFLSAKLERRAERKPAFKRRLQWAERQIRQRGGPLLITARFIPGGRTLLTISSGVTHQPRRWFVTWIAIATVIWATYSALLGYIGGKAFADDHTKAFLTAFGIALTATVVIEIVRHLYQRRHPETVVPD